VSVGEEGQKKKKRAEKGSLDTMTNKAMYGQYGVPEIAGGSRSRVMEDAQPIIPSPPEVLDF